MGGPLVALAGIGLVFSTWVAWRLPILALALALVLVGAYSLFRNAPGYNPYGLYLGGGMSAPDLLLIGMAATVTMRALIPTVRRRLGPLLVPVACLSVWFLIEALRNFSTMGLSTFGEFRTRYLILILPLFAATGLRSVRSVKIALALFVSFALVLPVVLSPIVLYLNGWALSAAGSLYNAHISLGIFLGLLVLWTCPTWIRWPKAAVYALTALGALEMAVDAHRSVWVAAILAISLLWATKASVESTVRRLCIVLLGLLGVALLQMFSPLHIWDIIVDRGGAALALEDTAAWRAAVQKASLRIFAESPVAGRGLGMYWQTYVPELGRVITVFPHSIYVMVLVHLGAVGGALLVWLGLASWRGLHLPSAMTTKGSTTCDPAELSRAGMAALVGLVGFGFAYGFEAYVLLLIGICLAGVLLTKASRRPAH